LWRAIEEFIYIDVLKKTGGFLKVIHQLNCGFGAVCLWDSSPLLEAGTEESIADVQSVLK
jgi:hypothetical protein